MRIAILIYLILGITANAAQAADLHAFWDNRCAECHGHAAAFARRHLHVEAGVLRGQKPERDLVKFLTAHEAGSEMANPLYAMLLAQTQTEPLYNQKCSGCHDTAAVFARSSLVLRDGVLTGRGNGRPVADFLKRHGKLTAAEVPVMVDVLTRVLGEAGGTTSKP